jgi:two-component system nitrate/nitrite response regulator NarL
MESLTSVEVFSFFLFAPDVVRSREERQMSKLFRVAIVDDHPLFRDGMVSMLMRVDGIEVVGEGATAADALKIAQEHAPDVMLVDVRLPGGGVEAAASIAGACPNVRIIMVTASEDEHDVTSALRAGARGYILKGSSGDDLVATVWAVAEGGSYVAPHLAAQLLINRGNRIEAVADYNPHDLTSREEEILALVARGMSNKEVAQSFKCTERTIKYHMTNIMQKLNVRNRVQAVLKFQLKGSRVPDL